MDKPVKKYCDKMAYEWSEIVAYIKEKYNKDLGDNWNNNKDGDYQCFWHWIVEMQEPHNGSYFYVDCNYPQKNSEWVWINEPLNILKKEFPEEDGELYCHVWW